MDDILNRIAELEAQIAALPAGSITKKTVSGKVYYYHRWTEDKKRKEKYVSEEDVPALREQIEERKALEAELKALKKQAPKKPAPKKETFIMNVRIGEALQVYSAPVRRYKKRGCYQKLHDFVYGDVQDRVFILYGLRRTGKTTLIRQILAEMTDTDLSKAAFIQATVRNNLAQLN